MNICAKWIKKTQATHSPEQGIRSKTIATTNIVSYIPAQFLACTQTRRKIVCMYSFVFFQKLAFIFYLTCGPLYAVDALTYGIETKNSEHIRKALLEIPQKELEVIFQQEQGEQVAQALITEACQSPLVLLRLEGLFGMLHANNATSALFIEKALEDPHENIRFFARQASENFFDSFIRNKLVHIAKTKRGGENIDAFAIIVKQDPEQALTVAGDIFSNKDTPLLEKRIIGELLTQSLLYSQLNVQAFAKTHPLAPETFLYLSAAIPALRTNDLLISGLTSDSFLSQLAALESLGVWGIPSQDQDTYVPLIRAFLESSNSLFRAKAAWVALCHIQQLKEEGFSDILALSLGRDQDAELVAKTLVRLGTYGIDLAKTILKNNYANPIARLNSGLFLLKQRVHDDAVANEMLVILKNINRPLYFDERADGKVLLFCPFDEDDIGQQIARTRDAEVRCYVLGLLLTTAESKDIERRIYKMAEDILKKRSWGPIFEGGTTLFFQVGPNALPFVRALSKSLYEEVRIQTAGILAFLGCKQEALQIVKQEWTLASFEGKMVLLALLPHFSFQQALPFLIASMKDRSSLMRARAAGVFLYMKYR